MKNAHLRFGWLTYVKSTEKTTTSIKLRLDRFIGEVLPDPPRQAKAHLISVIGGDTQIAAVSAAISLGDRFMVEGPRRTTDSSMSRAQTPSVSKARYSLPGAKSHCVTLSRCRKSSLPATYRRAQEEPCWQARKTDSFGPLSPIFTGSPECRTGLTGLPANWKRIRRSSVLSVSDVPRCWSKARRNSFFPGSVGALRVEPSVFRLKLVRSAGRV